MHDSAFRTKINHSRSGARLKVLEKKIQKPKCRKPELLSWWGASLLFIFSK
jgi:hypothetical protein